jgi:hypothetical protein
VPDPEALKRAVASRLHRRHRNLQSKHCGARRRDREKPLPDSRQNCGFITHVLTPLTPSSGLSNDGSVLTAGVIIHEAHRRINYLRGKLVITQLLPSLVKSNDDFDCRSLGRAIDGVLARRPTRFVKRRNPLQARGTLAVVDLPRDSVGRQRCNFQLREVI